MMDKKNLHEEAEEIRDETAAAAPELAEHDRVAELERLLEELSFDAPDLDTKRMSIDAAYVRQKLEAIVKDEDLSRYIL